MPKMKSGYLVRIIMRVIIMPVLVGYSARPGAQVSITRFRPRNFIITIIDLFEYII